MSPSSSLIVAKAQAKVEPKLKAQAHSIPTPGARVWRMAHSLFYLSFLHSFISGVKNKASLK